MSDEQQWLTIAMKRDYDDQARGMTDEAAVYLHRKLATRLGVLDEHAAPTPVVPTPGRYTLYNLKDTFGVVKLYRLDTITGQVWEWDVFDWRLHGGLPGKTP